MVYIIISSIVIGLLLLILLISFLFYYLAFYGQFKPSHKMSTKYITTSDEVTNLIKKVEAIPYEEVYIKSYDGLKLFGRYYHVKDNAPVNICFHGYRGFATRDFCGGSLLVLESEQNLLLIDERASGRSEGHTITLGVKEKYDCLSWVNYVIDRFGEDTKIILRGISMGAAIVLMALGLNLPQNVIGISADCPYSSPKEIIYAVFKANHIPKCLYFFLKIGVALFGHFNLNDKGAVETVKNAHVPILLIHGEADGFVPCYMSKAIYEANPSDIKLITFPNADHGWSYFVDNERYRREFFEFNDKLLNNK